MYDIHLISGEFGDAKGIRSSVAASIGYANTVLTDLKATIKESSANKMLFAMPYNHIKTLKAAAGGTYDTHINIQKSLMFS